MKHILVAVAMFFAASAHAVGDEGKPATTPAAPFRVGERILPLLQNYCVYCHGNQTAEGEVRLDNLESLKLDPNDSILSLSERLAKYGGGGTDCSLPLQAANTRYSKRKFAGVVLVSDNQSWVYQHQVFAAGTNGSTGLMTQWNQFVQNQKRHGQWSPKLICIDLQPLGTTQAPEREDILNIGGFSDAVFNVIAAFLGNDTNRFVAEIEAVEL